MVAHLVLVLDTHPPAVSGRRLLRGCLHTMSELTRVCQKVVIIATYQGATPAPTKRSTYVFYHDYAGISTELGCEMNHVIANEGRLLFTMTRR